MKNKGFTLIDMVVAVGVGGVVLLIFMNVISFMRMSEAKYRFKADARISRSVGERFLWMGMKNAAPSFNVLNVLDDSSNSFYELNRDLPSLTPPPASRRRSISLSPASPQKTFLALITNTNVADANAGKPSMIYLDPAKLFPISLWTGTGPAPAFTLDWSLFQTFINNANNNMLVSTGGMPVFLEVFIPSNYRSATQTSNDAPNPASFFLKYSGGVFTTETFGGLYTARHPTNPSVLISDLGQFIRQMPSASGGIPPLIVRAVRLVRYEIYPDPVKLNPKIKPPLPPQNYWHLRYTTWDGTAFVSPVMIADNVNALNFIREDIGDPAIKINLEKDEELQ